jgi:hypothetical protein
MTPTPNAVCAASFSLSGTWPNLPIDMPSILALRRGHLDLDRCLDYSLN